MRIIILRNVAITRRLLQFASYLCGLALSNVHVVHRSITEAHRIWRCLDRYFCQVRSREGLHQLQVCVLQTSALAQRSFPSLPQSSAGLCSIVTFTRINTLTSARNGTYRTCFRQSTRQRRFRETNASSIFRCLQKVRHPRNTGRCSRWSGVEGFIFIGVNHLPL